MYRLIGGFYLHWCVQVDKHIRRLDSDLSRFEQELKMREPGMRRTSISSIVEAPTAHPIST